MYPLTLIREYSFGSLSIHKPASENKLADICNYIAEHYTDRILLDNICFLFATNKTTLCQNFRREYGITILNYIDQLRLKDAKKLLRKRKFSVTEISDQLGFSSVHYFCRYFKKHTGMSSKEFQNDVS